MKIFNELSGRQCWRSLIIVAICWGCLLRFYQLDGKVYWEDETFTSLRLSGYSDQELIDTAFQGEIVYPDDLLQFQVTHADKGFGDTINSLTDDTHPPGYFALLRLWTTVFGSSISSIRALSATVSLLLLPGVFGLAWLLFEQSPQRQEIAELATALAAVSPYQITLASEARMYSLLPVVTTLAGLCLLRAVRSRTTGFSWRWKGYGLVGIASLYVHWLAIPMLTGYGAYVWLQAQASRSWYWARAKKRYLLTTACMLGAVMPWFLFMGIRMGKVYTHTKWTGETVGFWGEGEGLAQQWLQHGLLLFFEGDILLHVPLLRWLGGGLAIACIMGGLIYLVRHTALSVWSFLIISSGIIYVPLAMVDLLFGGWRSGLFRYLAPSLGAIEISVAFCLVSLSRIGLNRINLWPGHPQALKTHQQAPLKVYQHKEHQHKTYQHKAHQHKTYQHKAHQHKAYQKASQKDGSRRLTQFVAQGTIVLLLLAGAASKTIAKVTYSAEQHPIGSVASVVNDTPGALLVSDAPRPSVMLPLAHMLKAQTPLMLTVRPQQPALDDLRDRPVFLYLASESFQASLKEQGNHLQPVEGVENLFSIRVEGTPNEALDQEVAQN